MEEVTVISTKGKKSPQSRLQLPSDPWKAYRMGHSDGFDDAMDATLNIMVWSLVDNEFMNREQIGEFISRFKSTMDMIENQNVNLTDIKKSLKKEYEITVTLR